MGTVITVKDIRPPTGNARSACITTTDNEKLWLWPTKLGLVKVGGTYEADIEANDRGFKNIKTIRATPPPAAAAAPREPFQSGAYRSSDNAPPLPAGCTKDEQIFVQGMVQSLIRSGEVSLDTVEAAVMKMRGIWRRTLGRAVMQQHIDQQAAE